MNTIITLSVDIQEYTLGNKYDAVTFEISSGRGHGQGNGRGIQGRSFKSPVKGGDTVTWTGDNKEGIQIEIREISPKDLLANYNVLASIEYKNKSAIGVIEIDLPNKIKEYYDITIAVTYKDHTFPDFTIDPALEYHRP